MKHTINDNISNRGLEGWYEIQGNKLVVFIEATNSIEDWISNFTAFPVPLAWPDLFLGFCHSGYRRYAYWLAGFIQNLVAEHQPNKVAIFGYSMGGGIAQITALILGQNIVESVRVVSIDGPKTTTVLPRGVNKTYYNKGSLVNSIPFWFVAMERWCLNKKWRWFWKSHADYDIEGIISKEVSI